MNALLIYQRGHNRSEGASFTMGVRERFDVLGWIDWINRKKPGGKIVLYGWSMGANTVMGALGEDLPENVECAVCDCGYLNLFDQLQTACRLMLPKVPFVPFFTGVLDLYCRLFQGFSVRYSVKGALERCKTPVLFIHGSADKLVLYDKIDLIVPERRAELVADLEKRVGVKIDNLEIGHVDFLRDAAFIKIYYTLEKGQENSIDTLTRAKDFIEQ